MYGKVTEVPGTWTPELNVGDLDEAPYIWPGSSLAIVDVQGVKQQMEDIYLSLSSLLVSPVTLPFKEIKNLKKETCYDANSIMLWTRIILLSYQCKEST